MGVMMATNLKAACTPWSAAKETCATTAPSLHSLQQVTQVEQTLKCSNGTLTRQSSLQQTDVEENAEYYETVLRLLLAVMCPVIVLGLILAGILLVMRHAHKRRMARLVLMEGSQDPDYTFRDELRVTAAGDSTLRVR